MQSEKRTVPGVLFRAVFLLGLAAVFSLPSHASTLRLVNPSNTAFNPGVTDDTVAVGDTFILELWLDATDTYVNGLEVSLQYDGTQLELLESSDATDSFPPASAGINSDEDHTTFGDILANDGLFSGAAGDTVHYAALTTADSTMSDTRIVRFLFQVRTTATPKQTTAITFQFGLNETTVVTGADTNAPDVLSGTDTGLILIQPAPDTHLVFTLISPGATNLTADFFSIYNPTSDTVDLSTYYVADDSAYYQIVNKANPVNANDFVARFPTGTKLGPSETVTVAVSSDAFFKYFPGVKLDFELTQDGTADGVADMADSDIGGSVSLRNVGEVLILFQWDGQSDLVKDVDIVRWGTGVVPDKSGVTIDGPDIDAFGSTYRNDSGLMTALGTPGAKQVLRRTTYGQGDTGFSEPKFGGNGITGHDETSEDVGASWAPSSDSRPWHEMAIAFKRGEAPAYQAEAFETAVEGLIFHVGGARGNADTLIRLDVTSLGVADTANIDTVSLWIDANGDSVIDSNDTFVADLTEVGPRAWRFTGSVSLPAIGGREFILGFAVLRHGREGRDGPVHDGGPDDRRFGLGFGFVRGDDER